MKHSLLIIFCSLLLALNLYAQDEPLIPTALNTLLPRLKSGMSIEEAKALFSPSYPKLRVESLLSGYIDFALDDRCTLSVAGRIDNGKIGRLSTYYICIRDATNTCRLEISQIQKPK